MARRRSQRGPMTNLFIRLVVNTGALAAAAGLVNYFAVGVFTLREGPFYIGDWQSAIIASMLIGLVNALIRPVVLMTTCLLQVVTLGLFTLVVNGLMLLLASWLAERFSIAFRVDGFGAAFWGAVLISLVSTVLTKALK